MKLLRPDQVADRLGISKRSAYRLMKSGELVAVDICGLKVTERSLEKYINKMIQIYEIENGKIKKQ